MTNKFIRNLVHLKTLGFMKMTNLPGGTWETTTAKSLALNKISSLEKKWRLNRIVKRNVVSIKLKLFCHFLILPYFDFQWCHISILPYFDFQWCHISILPYFDFVIIIQLTQKYFHGYYPKIFVVIIFALVTPLEIQDSGLRIHSPIKEQ